MAKVRFEGVRDFFHKILESNRTLRCISLSISHCTVNVMSRPKVSFVHDLFRSVRRRWLLHRTVRHHPQAAVLPAHNTALICDSRDRQGPGHCRLQPGHLRVRIQLSSARLKLCWRRSLTSYDIHSVLVYMGQPKWDTRQNWEWDMGQCLLGHKK